MWKFQQQVWWGCRCYSKAAQNFVYARVGVKSGAIAEPGQKVKVITEPEIFDSCTYVED